MIRRLDKYEPTVGQVIDTLSTFDRDARIWFEINNHGQYIQLTPIGTAGHKDSPYHVLIDEGSYQNTIYFEIKN